MEKHYEGIKECYYRVSAKAILRNSEGKFALCMKEMKVHGELLTKWDIPGGGIDHGENVFTTLKREIKEEMGLTVKHIEKRPKYFFLGESSDEETPLGLLYYEVETENFDYTPSEECREMKFFSLKEALDADVWPAVRTTFEEAKELFGEF